MQYKILLVLDQRKLENVDKNYFRWWAGIFTLIKYDGELYFAVQDEDANENVTGDSFEDIIDKTNVLHNKYNFPIIYDIRHEEGICINVYYLHPFKESHREVLEMSE